MIFFEDPNLRMGSRTLEPHKVYSFLIDHSDIELEIKRQQLLNNKKIDFQYNLFELTDQMSKIVDQYKLEVEHFPVIQQIVNSLFYKTYWYFMFQMVLYYGFYLIPFGLQLLNYDHTCYKDGAMEYCNIHDYNIKVCNYICMGVTIIFFLIDMIYMKVHGIELYFNEEENWLDFIWCPF